MVAAWAALLVTVTSLMFLSAPQASAQTPPPPGLEAKVTQAKADARAALNKAQCNALLTGALTDSPRDVLDTSTTPFRAVPPPPLPANTVASVQIPQFRVGFSPLNQPISIHQGFDEIGKTLTLNFAADRAEIDINDFPRQRAVAILHEVGHLTGVEGAHEGLVAENGARISRDREERLYNTRILNACFAPRYLITGLSCVQNVVYNSIYDYRSTLDCFAGCRTDVGPVTMSWSSSLQPIGSTDVTTTMDGEVCTSFRTSACPIPNGVSSRPEITLTVTDSIGLSSTDTVIVDCLNFRAPVW